jgi:hypothetical protein
VFYHEEAQAGKIFILNIMPVFNFHGKKPVFFVNNHVRLALLFPPKIEAEQEFLAVAAGHVDSGAFRQEALIPGIGFGKVKDRVPYPVIGNVYFFNT